MFKKMSIKLKINFSFGVILMFMFFTGIYVFFVLNQFEKINQIKTLRYEQIDLIKDLRLINKTITLTAMDSIVDKQLGYIEKERLDEFDTQFKIVKEKEKHLLALADTKEEKELMAKIIKAFKGVEPIIKIELKKLIESRASDEAFEKLDNDIDAVAGSMDGDIAKVIKSVTAELQEAYEDEEALSTFLKASILFGIAFVFVVGLILAKLLSNNIVNGLKSLNEAIENLITSKDTSSRVKTKSQDELGDIANNFNRYLQSIENGIKQDVKLIDEAKIIISDVKKGLYSNTIKSTTSNKTINEFKDQVNEMIETTKKHFENINKTLAEYSNYNYTKKLILNDIEVGSEFDILSKDINNLRDAITNMLIENKNDGTELNNYANSLLSNVTTLSTSSNKAAAALEETAAALEEITSNVNASSEKIAQMSKLANSVTASASQGQELATQTTKSMDEINTQVTAINEAISVIDQIAFQTNILSLNAAVEAATAGEAGKGFAVVAGEVRSLAARSAEAASEIKALVETATTKANDGKKISDQMIEGYNGLNENIDQTIKLIEEVTLASKEQQSGIIQINDSINSLDHQTQANASVANETKTISDNTSRIANKIVEDADSKEFEGK